MVKTEQKEKLLIEALKKVAPGTDFREALDHILDAKTGAIIVVGDSKKVDRLCNGGFGIKSPFTPQKLFELAKLDGAIVVDEEISWILKANVHLVPDSKLPTSETGMRHRTAERVARQTKALVISISQRRDVVSLCINGVKYILDDIRALLTKANQALQTLERYKARLDQVSSNLNAVEFENLVTLHDVVTVLQRAEMVRRVSGEIKRYITELGVEGRLIRMQLDELMVGVEEDNILTIRDYCLDMRRVEKTKRELRKLSSDELLDPLKVSHVLGCKESIDELDQSVSPRGYRLLRKVPRLPILVVDKIVAKFGSLQNTLKASVSELDEVEGVGEVRARAILDGLKRLKEYNLMERYV